MNIMVNGQNYVSCKISNGLNRFRPINNYISKVKTLKKFKNISKLSFYIFISNDIYVIFRFNSLSIVRKRQKITFCTVVKPSLFATTNAFALPFQDVGCSALEFNINALSVEGFHRCLFTLFFTSSVNMERRSSQAVES